MAAVARYAFAIVGASDDAPGKHRRNSESVQRRRRMARYATPRERSLVERRSAIGIDGPQIERMTSHSLLKRSPMFTWSGLRSHCS